MGHSIRGRSQPGAGATVLTEDTRVFWGCSGLRAGPNPETIKFMMPACRAKACDTDLLSGAAAAGRHKAADSPGGTALQVSRLTRPCRPCAAAGINSPGHDVCRIGHCRHTGAGGWRRKASTTRSPWQTRLCSACSGLAPTAALSRQAHKNVVQELYDSLLQQQQRTCRTATCKVNSAVSRHLQLMPEAFLLRNQVALRAVAHTFAADGDFLRELRYMFNTIDVDGSGTITHDEMVQVQMHARWQTTLRTAYFCKASRFTRAAVSLGLTTASGEPLRSRQQALLRPTFS